ncbi:tail terminator [Idiomarinaceae phage Phi1M2-2]|uniref:tail terminator n=1 Tax=Idiomarinaceae phage Phi1M2-2 TaxID=1527515 RepID=UPI0004F7B7DB|nr:tail terminator [Idiomarinaceae phage Phi1M2-2]AIM40773.1 putative tail minor protein [Idiomarinaceae phage Phi1M2-2]
MTFTDEHAAIINRLLAEVPFIPTEFPNTPVYVDEVLSETTTPQNTMWRRVTILRSPATPWTAGKNGKDERNGIIDIDIFAPKGSGVLAANAHADLIEAAIKWRNLEQNGVCLHTRTATASPIDGGETWYGVKVSVQFRSYPKRS